MHDHEKGHQHDHHEPGFHGDGERQVIPGRKWHKDWRVWTVVLLMLAAMAAYVFGMDGFATLIGQPRAKPPAPQQTTP